MEVLNSLTKELNYDGNITFRIVVKIIHTVADTQTIQSKNLTDELLYQQAPTNNYRKLKFIRN